MPVVKKMGGGFGYLKKDSGLYDHEDGRYRDEDGRRCREMPRLSYMKAVVKVMKTVFVEKTVHLTARRPFFKEKSLYLIQLTKDTFLC